MFGNGFAWVEYDRHVCNCQYYLIFKYERV